MAKWKGKERLFAEVRSEGARGDEHGANGRADTAVLTCRCSCCAGLNPERDDGQGGATVALAPQNLLAVAVPSSALAGQTDTAALAAGTRWGSVDRASGETVITYSFMSAQASTFSYTSDFQRTLSAFSPSDVQLTRVVLGRIEAVANVRFVEVADNAAGSGMIRYGYSQLPNAMGYAGYSFFPSLHPQGGEVWIGADQARPQWDFYRPNLFLHETLHALGLKHPFSGVVRLSADKDIIPNTVMSYSPVAGSSSGIMSVYPAEPMLLDVAALQALYGDAATAAADTVYDLAAPEFRAFRTIWDAGGTDTLDASRVAAPVVLDLNEGARSSIGAAFTASGTVGGSIVQATYGSTFTIAHRALIENAIGSPFADRIVGNAAANQLRGGAGNDVLEGRAGDDWLWGGAGDDILDGGEGVDTALYEGGRSEYAITRIADGYVVRHASGASDTLTGVERLVFADAGLALDLDADAGAVAKTLGAVFGKSAVTQPHFVRIGLDLLAQGLTYQDLVQVALGAQLHPDPTHREVVELLYSNVVASAPSAEELGYFESLLESGAASHASLGLLAAESHPNAVQIGLAGIASTGLAFSP